MNDQIENLEGRKKQGRSGLDPLLSEKNYQLCAENNEAISEKLSVEKNVSIVEEKSELKFIMDKFSKLQGRVKYALKNVSVVEEKSELKFLMDKFSELQGRVKYALKNELHKSPGKVQEIENRYFKDSSELQKNLTQSPALKGDLMFKEKLQASYKRSYYTYVSENNDKVEQPGQYQELKHWKNEIHRQNEQYYLLLQNETEPITRSKQGAERMKQETFIGQIEVIQSSKMKPFGEY